MMRCMSSSYRRSTGSVSLKTSSSGAQSAAFDRRLALDRQNMGDTDVEVVVFEAKSLDELKATHGRYFSSAGQIAREFSERV